MNLHIWKYFLLPGSDNLVYFQVGRSKKFMNYHTNFYPDSGGTSSLTRPLVQHVSSTQGLLLYIPQNPSVPHTVWEQNCRARLNRAFLSDLCDSDEFVLNWRICVETTDFCGADGFKGLKGVALVWNWRVELSGVWNKSCGRRAIIINDLLIMIYFNCTKRRQMMSQSVFFHY